MTEFLSISTSGRQEGNVLFMVMASDIWLRTILIVRKETRCCHIGYSFRLSTRVLLYAPSHRQDRIAHTTAFVTPVVEHWLEREIAQWVPMSIYISVCQSVCLYIYLSVYLYLYVFLSVYLSICLSIYVCRYVCV